VLKGLTDLEKRQAIIERFLSHKKRIGWANQMKMLKELLLIVPDYNFWYNLEPPTKIFTLSYFKTKEGEAFVNEAYKNSKVDLSPRPKEVKLGDKIGKDKKITPQKPKTLKEFLNAKTKKDTDAGC
tara:strand:- start:1688 stop:2065 length:378 start_codon:yes stop_codon:yes gene_type:complete